MILSGSLRHVAARHQERIGKVRINQAICRLKAMIRSGRMPNGAWYRPVRDQNNNTLGYIVGQGVWISSILAPGMVPRGKQV